MRASHLYGQAQRVEHDEHEHDVLKAGGVDHVPELVLVRVLGDVPPQRTSLECILHTLALCGHTGAHGDDKQDMYVWLGYPCHPSSLKDTVRVFGLKVL